MTRGHITPGTVVGRLTAIEYVGERLNVIRSYEYAWRWRCACGRECTKTLHQVRAARRAHGTAHCGCLSRRHETRQERMAREGKDG